MPAGTPINRQWVLIMRDGSVVIDWGGGRFLDINNGDMRICSENEISHHIQDSELDHLKSTGQVSWYNNQLVYFPGLPDRPLPTLD
jgi:hypothetical protein